MQSPLQVHDFYVFERSGRLLLQQSFTRIQENADERGKLVYGVLLSLKQMIPSLSPPDQMIEEGIRSLSTKSFTLHAFESPTGYRFAVVTSVANQSQQGETRKVLERIFSEYFVDLVMLDPSYKPGSKIDNPAFVKAVTEAMQIIGTI